MLEIGSLVDGKYKILNKVGQGGMSIVYLAMNEKANKQWAIKEVRKDGIKDFEVVKQGLVVETDMLKKLSHPSLPSIVDVIEDENTFLIVMDYIQGNPLSKALEEYGAQPQEQVIKWAKQLCDVLGYLHTRTPAIIYRDMKPANVMLNPNGNVTLIDFGTAREFKEKNLADTTCLGTVGYAAPEQFGGMGQTDARTDIYCLGATLYHLVTGMNPCEPPYEIKPIRQINPALSGGLEKIIQKCTQRNPEDRYQSCAELMYALEHYDEIDDIYRRKQKKKLTAFIMSVVMVFAGAGVSAWGYTQAEAKKSENYDYILSMAEEEEAAETVVENYYEAMITDPTREEAYIGLISYLTADDDLDSEDISYIRKISMGLEETDSAGNTDTVNVLDELRNSSEELYKSICYRFGEALLYYYNVGEIKDRYSNAAEWFQKVVDYSDKKQERIAKIYCDMSECLINISKYKGASISQTSKITGEYASLWERIKELKNDAAALEDVDSQMQAWELIEELLRDDADGFNDAVELSEMTSVLQDIYADTDRVTLSALKEKTDELKKKIEGTISKIETLEK